MIEGVEPEEEAEEEQEAEEGKRRQHSERLSPNCANYHQDPLPCRQQIKLRVVL
jgi:hypothetical protein